MAVWNHIALAGTYVLAFRLEELWESRPWMTPRWVQSTARSFC